MLFFSLPTLSIALYTLSHVSTAPIDGLTQRSPKIIGLDFEVKRSGDGELIVERDETGVSTTLLNEGYYYLTYLELGSDHQKVGVEIDTGSSDLWVPDTKFSGTSHTTFGTFNNLTSTTFHDLERRFYINYAGNRPVLGTFVTDSVAIGSVSVDGFQFGYVTSALPLSATFGIGLSSGEAPLLYKYGTEYDNFPIALKKAGHIDKAAYSLYLNEPHAASGSILFGGKDTAKIDGQLHKLQHTGLAGAFEIKLDSLSFGNKTVEVNHSMLLDSGSAYSYFPKAVAADLFAKLGGDGSATGSGTLYVPCDVSGNFTYHFGNLKVDIPLTDLVFSAGNGKCVTSFVSGGNILGVNFLRYAYVIFDVEDASIQLAKVKFTDDSSIVPL